MEVAGFLRLMCRVDVERELVRRVVIEVDAIDDLHVAAGAREGLGGLAGEVLEVGTGRIHRRMMREGGGVRQRHGNWERGAGTGEPGRACGGDWERLVGARCALGLGRLAFRKKGT